MATVLVDNPDLAGVTPSVLALRSELASHSLIGRAKFEFGDLTGEVCQGRDSLWAILRRPKRGGIAIRIAFAPSGIDKVKTARQKAGDALRLSVDSAIGRHDVVLKTDGLDLHRLQVTVTLTPAAPLLVPFLPRDLYPLDENDDPTRAVGTVEAGQRGLNSGLLYFHIDRPAFGSVLYFQNLTATNDYYRSTQTRPDGAVGGKWPELGYLPPTRRQPML
jgi:hypothetical protein